jgi:hypothetical protein|tara:strand:+ start:28 stop:240 length:213 start_codon:yes stop_codon:yes gene_type:complete
MSLIVNKRKIENMEKVVIFEDMPQSVIDNEFAEETYIPLDLIQRYPFALEQLDILKKDYLGQGDLFYDHS